MLCHICDNPRCVNPSHLYVGTYADNARDKKDRDREHPLRGELNGRAKLTPSIVRAIRADKVSSNTALAAQHRVSEVAISYARSGKTWANIE